jgi:Trk-type K+ transport system membrane component
LNAWTVVQAKASVVLALGISLLVPLAVSHLYGDRSWPSFLVPALIMAFVGGAGMLSTRASSSRSVEYVSNRDVYRSVMLAWVLAALRGGVPFLVNGTLQLPGLARRVYSWIGKGQHYYWRIELLQVGRSVLTGSSRRSISLG